MMAQTATEAEPKPRPWWRRALALAVAPWLIWAPVFIWILTKDNMEAERPFALVILEVLFRKAPLVYGLYGPAALAVSWAGKGRPKLRTGWAILVLFGLVCTVFFGLAMLALDALPGGGETGVSALQGGLLAGMFAIPVALAYSLIAGVRWR